MPWGLAAAAVIGGVANYAASSNAANAQQAAAQTASNTQLSMFNTSNQQQAPWRQAGGQGLNALSQFYGLGGVNTSAVGGASTGGQPGTPDYNSILSNLPGYQFQQQQGQLATQRNLAAGGLLNSGAAQKELTQYGQGLAQNYAQQYTGGLQSLAGLGQSSVQATGALGANAANQIGSNQIYAGNAAASGYANQANAFNQGLSGLAGAYGQYNMQNQIPAYAGSSTYGQAPYSGSGTYGAGGNTVNQGGYISYVPNPN